MRLMPTKRVGNSYITSWYFGCDSDGEPYGVAVAYSANPWGVQLPSYSYREFWL
jgi:hypothetical protein